MKPLSVLSDLISSSVCLLFYQKNFTWVLNFCMQTYVDPNELELVELLKKYQEGQNTKNSYI